MAAGLFELLPRRADFVPTQSLRQMQGAVAGHSARGRKAGGAFWVAQSVTFCGGETALRRLPHTRAAFHELTQTGGSLATKVHGVQAHRALGSSHVEAHGEAVSGVVVHKPLSFPVPLAVLQAAAEL